MERPATGGMASQAHLDLHRADAYGRSFSEVYDDWYTDVTDAEATARFVAARCSKRPVLELGVGSGRLALPLAALGVAVVGLDGSAAMLSRMPQHRGPGSVNLVQADMRNLPFRGRLGAVLIAFNTLFNLGREQEQGALLGDLARLMDEGSSLIIEAIDAEALDAGPPHSIGLRSVDADRMIVTATQLDTEAQTLTGQHVEISDDGISLRPWRLRWLTVTQLDGLAATAGLTLTERYGSWTEAPFVGGSGTHVSVYRLAKP